MYNLTRIQAAQILDVSTRSIDRYVKAWKLRSKKEGKIIYIHEQDIKNIANLHKEKIPEIITPPRERSYSHTSHAKQSQDPLKEVHIANQASSAIALEKIYIDLRSEIKQKDQAIQDLSIKLGQAQEIAKNSVSLIEFKKSQFLLEESKWHLSQEISSLRESSGELEKKLQYEKSTNYILIAFCIILMLVAGFLWFLNI